MDNFFVLEKDFSFFFLLCMGYLSPVGHTTWTKTKLFAIKYKFTIFKNTKIFTKTLPGDRIRNHQLQLRFVDTNTYA